jgi:hypothetical protein
MRTIDRFFSQLERLGLSLKPGESPGEQTFSRLCSEFSSLVSPVIGRQAASDLFYRTLERAGPDTAPQKLGALAAFFLGEFEDLQVLDDEDLEDLQKTIKDVSGEINLHTLTTLMGELLARGKL